MIYDLGNTSDRKRFASRVTMLWDKGRIAELTEKKPQRTLSQNAYLHALLGWFALEYGETMGWVKDHYFKRLCNADVFVRVKSDKLMGEVEYLRSSRDCDTGEMTLAVDRFRDWSNKECGIYLPTPEDKMFLQQIEIEMSRSRQWL